MSLDTTPYENDVKARVQTICPRVYVTGIPDTVATPTYPYVVLRWVEPIRTAFDHHMVGSRDDTMRGSLIVETVSPSDDASRAVNNRIRLALTGYRPPDCGEMRPEGGSSFSTKNDSPKPTTYSRELYFTFVTNLSPNPELA